MFGICVAVNATTRLRGSSRNTVLKLWKSRPAAPMMMIRVGTGALLWSVRRRIIRGRFGAVNEPR